MMQYETVRVTWIIKKNTQFVLAHLTETGTTNNWPQGKSSWIYLKQISLIGVHTFSHAVSPDHIQGSLSAPCRTHALPVGEILYLVINGIVLYIYSSIDPRHMTRGHKQPDALWSDYKGLKRDGSLISFQVGALRGYIWVSPPVTPLTFLLTGKLINSILIDCAAAYSFDLTVRSRG